MLKSELYYVMKIKEGLSLKQRVNPQYSLRAYAKFLGIHSSTLSQIFNGKRSLPAKAIKDITDKLNLSDNEKTLFVESFYQNKSHGKNTLLATKDTRFILDDSYAKVIAEWEHYAVLTLFDLDDFAADHHGISNRLGITKTRAEVVINNLVACNLLNIAEDGKLEKTHTNVKTTEDIQSKALRDSHLETLEMGKNKIEEVEMELRDFSSMTIAMDLDRMPEVKVVIRDFRRKMAALLNSGKKTDVCQLAIQFYPITKNLSN